MPKNTTDYNNKYYQDNKASRKEKIRSRNLEAIQRNKTNFIEFMQDKHCIDCGFNDWRILQFDHVSGTKRNEISTMVTTAYSWQSILQEIDKCEIVCPNCHHIRTGTTFKFWRFCLPG